MKKSLCLLVVLSLIIVILTGCSGTSSENKEGVVSDSSSETVSQKTVIGHYNGGAIYREDINYTVSNNDVGMDFMTFEKNAVMNYAYTLAVKDFLKDIQVEDADIEEQMNYYKAMAESSGVEWDMYLLFYVGLTEDALREQIVGSLREQQYIKSLGEEQGVLESEILSYYDENKGYYDNIAIDVIPFSDVETYERGIELVESGKSVEEIAEELEIEILPERYVNIDSDITWNVDLADVNIGDIIYSLNTSDDITLAVGKVVKINKGISNEEILENVKYDLIMTKGSEEGNKRLNEYLKTITVDVYGEPVKLYQETED